MIQKWTVRKGTADGSGWCVYSPEGFYLCCLSRWEQAMNLASIRARESADKGVITLKLPEDKRDLLHVRKTNFPDEPLYRVAVGGMDTHLFRNEFMPLAETLIYHHLKGDNR